jgi:hypothetical protein
MKESDIGREYFSITRFMQDQVKEVIYDLTRKGKIDPKHSNEISEAISNRIEEVSINSSERFLKTIKSFR